MSLPAVFLEVLFCLMLHTEFFRTHLAGTSRTLVLGLSYLSVNGENIHQLEQDKSGPEVPVAISTDVLSLLWFSVFPILPLTVFLPPYLVSRFQKKNHQWSALWSHLQPLKSLMALSPQRKIPTFCFSWEPHGFLLVQEETLTPQTFFRQVMWRVWQGLRSCWYFRT